MLIASVVLALVAPVLGATQSPEHAAELFEKHRYAEAKSMFAALQRSDARSAVSAYYLGRIALIENDVREAIRQLERATALADGQGDYHYWLGFALREEGANASKFRLLGIVRRLRNEFERAVVLDPDHLDARFALVDFYAMAPSFIMGGGMEKARAQAQEIANRSPMRGAMARAVIAKHEDRLADEEREYGDAIRLAPESLAPYVARADMHVRAGNGRAAFETLDEYARRKPQDPWTRYHIGRTAGSTGTDLARGEASLKAFLASPPVDAAGPARARAHYWLGRIAQHRGDSAAARARYNDALALDRHSTPARKALAGLK